MPTSRATVAALAAVAARRNVQVVQRPYVNLDIPAQVAGGLDGELTGLPGGLADEHAILTWSGGARH